MSARSPYAEAYQEKGVLASRRFFIARRLSQAIFLIVFLTGPLFALWIAKGNLASSRTLDVLPLTDPFVLLQSLLARHWPEATALTGAAIVLGLYLVFGGRSYCAWVCPINPVTDLAAALRRKLGIKQTAKLRPEFRNYLAFGVLVLSFVSGAVAWELVNPITALHRALVFGLPFAATGALAIFVFDLFVAKDGWCGRRILRRARQGRRAARVRGQPQRLRRLHGLLCRVPGAACHLARVARRKDGREPGHSQRRLHVVRRLRRCLSARGLPSRASLQPFGRAGRDRSPRHLACERVSRWQRL